MDIQQLKKIAGYLSPIIKAINFPAAFLSGKSLNMEKAILWPVIESYSNFSKDSVIQYTTIPKNIDTVTPINNNPNSYANIAIILQGPVRYEDDFTLNTIKLYRKFFPDVKLILSTWKGLSQSYIAQVQKYGCNVVESYPPSIAGAGNINMQLESAYEGIKKAYELGCVYSLKTRTDQRIYANDSLDYLINLQTLFPSGDNNIVKKRLIYISYGKSFIYLPFNLCDFLVFGETRELDKLYGIERDTREVGYHRQYEKEQKKFNRLISDNLENSRLGNPYTLFPDFEDQYYKYMYAEYYIVYKYYSENIAPISSGDNLLELYHSYLKDFAIVADAEKLLIYWPKYATNNIRIEAHSIILALQLIILRMKQNWTI